MASSSIPKMQVESESTVRPNWLELPIDVTSNILQRLSTVELVTSACLVCPIWWNICKNPLMWRTIHMPYVCNSPYKYADLVKICCFAVERSRDHLEEIDIKYFGNDVLLNSIANNGSHLRCMRLVSCYWKISEKGFNEAVRKLPQLEEVDISENYITDASLKVLGRSCPLLKSLKYYYTDGFEYCECDDMAFAVAETMSGLCHLDFNGHEFTDVGLVAILDKCLLLKSLDIRGCQYVELSESLKQRCIDQINDLYLPDPSYFSRYNLGDYGDSYDDPYG